MSDVTTADKTLGEQMWDLLERNPENYDVTFSVGLEKKEVKAVKFLLKAASRVLQKEFQDKWEKAVMKDGEGIPLKDVDPTAFQLAVQLLIQDKWSVEVLKSLCLPPNTLVNLLRICRRFEITKAIKNLEEVADEVLRSFNKFTETNEFLKLKQQDLSALLCCESIPMEEKDIFESAYRWAEYQCSQKGLELTGENIREVIGPCLFEIRFPVMSNSDFAKAGRYKSNLLKADEKVAILNLLHWMRMKSEMIYTLVGSKFDQTQMIFKIQPRKLTYPKYQCSTLSLKKNQPIHQNPPFVCDGREFSNLIQFSNGKIELHGIGFFGPVLADAHYDVTVEIQKYGHPSYSSVTGKLQKRLFARKQEIFYFIFDTPVVLEPIQDESSFNLFACSYINFTLKGPDTVAVERNTGSEGPVEEGGIKFRFYWDNGRNQYAEYLYKKL